MTVATAIAPGYIPRAVALPRSEDYAFLRRRGLHHIERLAHVEWTDYNVHDPGITILELLCYAITDIGRRVAYPMRDLLEPRSLAVWQKGVSYRTGALVLYESETFRCLQDHVAAAGKEPGAGNAPWARDRQFHPAHEILVTRPVSFEDLRCLLIDIPGVRNAWVERNRDVTYFMDAVHHTLTDQAQTASIVLNGLFNVYIEYEDFVGDTQPQYRTKTPVGLPDNTGAGDFIAPAYKALEFDALEDAQLESVTLYADAAGTVVVRLLDGRAEVARTPPVNVVANAATVVPLNFTLRAGRRYHLDATDPGTTVKLYRTREATFPMSSPAVRISRGYATSDTGSKYYYFFYNWQVKHDSAGLTAREVRSAAIERIHASRNLCEDVINVCDLVPELIAICADIELRPDANADAVHAAILYAVYGEISPAVRFYSLDEMRAKGKSIDEIFQGPLLDHGFIDGDELDAIKRKCEIHASDIAQVIMDVDGVVAIKSLKLLKASDPGNPVDWILPLSVDRFRIASFAAFDDPGAATRFGSKVTFYKRGLPYYTNRSAVEPLYNQLKATDIDRKLKLRDHALPRVAGQWRDLASYEPLVNELPQTYCVGRIQVPDSNPARQALSRQLTAYLALFDQQLANFLSQLSHVGDLLTWRPVDVRTYFTQAVAIGIKGLDASADAGYGSLNDALNAIVETPAGAEARRLAFLEHLAARFAEQFDEYAGLMRSLIGATSAARLITQLRRFLEDYPATSAARGGAFDWRAPDVSGNVGGYQTRIYRLLDIDPAVRRNLAGHNFVIADHGTPASPQWRFELENDSGVVLFSSIACEAKSSIEALLDLSLRLGADAANYVTTAGTTTLVQRCSDAAVPDALGQLTGLAPLQDVVAYFAKYAASEGFHVIEHILLRRRTTADPFLPVQTQAQDSCCPDVTDPYSFRVSIVLPSWSPRFRTMRFRQFVEDTLRREAPAHVYPRICWVNHEQMKNLEVALSDWESRLAWLAHDAGACADTDGTRTGRLPLPAPDMPPNLDAYAASLTTLSDLLYTLTNVYPLAHLHDCKETDGDVPQVTLGATSLGTL